MKKSILIVIVVLLLMTISAGVTYLVMNSIKEECQTCEECPTCPTCLDGSIKLDSNNDWVYDASYDANVIEKSYYTLFDETFYLRDIVVPYININSSEAQKANNESKDVYYRAIEQYKYGLEDGYTFARCNYRKYIYDNNLSIILTYGTGGTDVIHYNYYTYNFNLENGNVLTYEDIYKSLGYTSDNIHDKVKNQITKEMTEIMKDFKYPENNPDGTNFDTYNNSSIKNYEDSVANNTIKCFVDNNKKLNVIVTLNIPAGGGYFDTIITIE